MAHAETRSLPFMQEDSEPLNRDNLQPLVVPSTGEQDDEAKIISILRHSLQDAGFQLLTRRDLDLVQALNADYLLRLSIMADVSALDETISQEFYPDRFDFQTNGTVTAKDNTEDFLYDGRVLVFWRGYGCEVSRGRLLLPKLDYLQASIVQRAASGIRERLNVLEEAVSGKAETLYDKIYTKSLTLAANALERIPSKRVSGWASATIIDMAERSRQREKEEAKKRKNEKLFKLTRYGGYRKSFTSSPNPKDALTPFTICEVGYGVEGSTTPSNTSEAVAKTRVNGNATTSDPLRPFGSEKVNHDIYEVMKHGEFTCSYDGEMAKAMGKDQDEIPPMQLLERVSISNLVDFSPMGRNNLLKAIFAKNTLMEPTYQEVIVVWRPLPPKPVLKPVLKPPKVVYDLADMFDIEGFEPPKEVEEEERRPSMEIRSFAGVPMANLPAVMPKTKLIFRPADAFVFDLVSIVSLILVIGSQRFDNPRLDLLALVSISLWVFRTVRRYMNKLARYDLLVKNFLTSKITHRNSGALKYVATEAGKYRATRAALVYTWLISPNRVITSRSCNDRDSLIQAGLQGVNELIGEDKPVRVDVGAALQDLEELELLHFSADGRMLHSIVRDRSSVIAALENKWASVFGCKETSVTKPPDYPRP